MSEGVVTGTDSHVFFSFFFFFFFLPSAYRFASLRISINFIAVSGQECFWNNAVGLKYIYIFICVYIQCVGFVVAQGCRLDVYTPSMCVWAQGCILNLTLGNLSSPLSFFCVYFHIYFFFSRRRRWFMIACYEKKKTKKKKKIIIILIIHVYIYIYVFRNSINARTRLLGYCARARIARYFSVGTPAQEAAEGETRSRFTKKAKTFFFTKQKIIIIKKPAGGYSRRVDDEQTPYGITVYCYYYYYHRRRRGRTVRMEIKYY